mmetsp:Transcript_20402/g.50997  ORF Transcript_20402/g.50997 Transcript_20402/m.50997 type:complete len:277 (+) Transcript_20402:498-1328(+)
MQGEHNHCNARDGHVQHGQLPQHPRHGHDLAQKAASKAVVQPACGKEQQQHVHQRQAQREATEHNEGDGPVHLTVEDRRAQRRQDLPRADLLVQKVRQAERINDVFHGAQVWIFLVEERHVHVQLHAGEHDAHTQQCGERHSQQGSGRDGEPPHAARFQPRGHLPRLQRGLVGQPQAKGGDRGAGAKYTKAREAQPQLQVAQEVRWLVETSEEAHHHDVGEHVRGGPLGHELHREDTAPGPARLRGVLALPGQPEGQKQQLQGWYDHRIGRDEGCS